MSAKCSKKPIDPKDLRSWRLIADFQLRLQTLSVRHLALIGPLMLQARIGQRPNKRMFEAIQLYLMGIPTLDRLEAEIEYQLVRIAAAKAKNRNKIGRGGNQKYLYGGARRCVINFSQDQLDLR